MGKCLSLVPKPAPEPEEKEAGIVELEMRLEERTEDYRAQVAISTDLRARLWLLTCEAGEQRKQLAMLRGLNRAPGRR